MEIIHAIILGIVEGLTEFLPVSSTGHLMLTSHFLGIEQSPFLSSFEIGIQSGAILVVIGYYFKKILSSSHLYKKIIIGFIPTAVAGLLLYPVIKTYLLESLTIVGWALLIGGIIILIVEYTTTATPQQEDLALTKEVTYTQAFLLGLYQILALIPGVSRSGATITGGLLSKIPRKQIVEFSFLLAIPTILGATFVDLMETGISFSSHEYSLLILGIITSAITSWFAIRFFIAFVSHHSFKLFGWYRVLAGILILVLI